MFLSVLLVPSWTEWKEKSWERIQLIDSFVLAMQPFQRGLFFFYSLYLWLLPDKFVHSYVTYIESWGVNAFCVETKGYSYRFREPKTGY